MISLKFNCRHNDEDRFCILVFGSLRLTFVLHQPLKFDHSCEDILSTIPHDIPFASLDIQNKLQKLYIYTYIGLILPLPHSSKKIRLVEISKLNLCHTHVRVIYIYLN